jgi:predicted ester cyclase
VIPIVALMRRYCDEFVNAQDPSRCVSLMSDDYRLHLAGREYVGRAEGYEPAVGPLFAQFPDLHVTIHEMLTDGSRLATRFTLCATSTRHGGNRAAWGGVAIYTWDGSRYTSVWVEEDHHLAREQLRSGVFAPPDQLPGPADPWAAVAGTAGDGVAEVAGEWLAGGGDGLLGTPVTVDALLVVGPRFAFHTSSPAVHVSGMAGVDDGGRVCAVSTFSDGGAG